MIVRQTWSKRDVMVGVQLCSMLLLLVHMVQERRILTGAHSLVKPCTGQTK